METNLKEFEFSYTIVEELINLVYGKLSGMEIKR